MSDETSKALILAALESMTRKRDALHDVALKLGVECHRVHAKGGDWLRCGQEPCKSASIRLAENGRIGK